MTTIDLHHEIHGEARPGSTPLLLVHGGGSTIGTNWSALLPVLTPSRPVIAVELQGHGHTPATDRPVSFDHSADDVATRLERLALGPVDVLGSSNGGQVALRFPHAVRHLVVATARSTRIPSTSNGCSTSTTRSCCTGSPTGPTPT